MVQRTEREGLVRIKKYPNRRFYDAAGRRHLTLSEIHAIICEGKDVEIRDSQSGEDLTHQVLTQIILERDAPKLSLFVPANILHRVIRTQNQMLGGVVEDYFRQMLSAHRASQERWSAFLRNTLGLGAPTPVNPLDWAKWFMPGMEAGTTTLEGRSSPVEQGVVEAKATGGAGTAHAKRSEARRGPESERPGADTGIGPGVSENSTIDELRRKIEQLERRISRRTGRARRTRRKPE